MWLDVSIVIGGYFVRKVFSLGMVIVDLLRNFSSNVLNLLLVWLILLMSSIGGVGLWCCMYCRMGWFIRYVLVYRFVFDMFEIFLLCVLVSLMDNSWCW